MSRQKLALVVGEWKGLSVDEEAAEEISREISKVMYWPVGVVSKVAGALLAGAVFNRLWSRIEGDKAPDALESRSSWSKVLLAAAMEGAIYSVVKAAIDRGSATAFERWFGAWPGK